MPELPEVEVSRQGILPHIVNKPITDVVVRCPKLRWPIPAEISSLKGAQISSVERRAKYLLLNSQEGTLIIHLGMSGKLRVIDSSVPLIKHDHFDLCFEDGLVLRFNDPRRFGALLWQSSSNQEPHPVLSNLGPEPLDESFNAEYLAQSCCNKSKAVKLTIMDNAVVVGVGNIYANESLFLAGIDPRRPASSLTHDEYSRLVDVIKEVLNKAIAQGGTTLKDFQQADGKPGYFAQYLYVYGRGGDDCRKCEEELQEIKQGQRATVFCGNCQT